MTYVTGNVESIAKRRTNASRLGIESEIANATSRLPSVAEELEKRVGNADPARLLPGEEPHVGWVEDRVSGEDSEEHRMIALYSDGANDREVAAALRMTKKAWDERLNIDDDFRRIVDFGAVLREAFWSRAGRRGLFMKGFNSALYQFLCKHQFGWGPGVGKAEDEGPREGESQDTRAAKAELAALLKRHQVG